MVGAFPQLKRLVLHTAMILGSWVKDPISFKAPGDVRLGAQGHAPTVKHPRTRMSICQRRYQHSKGGGDAMR